MSDLSLCFPVPAQIVYFGDWDGFRDTSMAHYGINVEIGFDGTEEECLVFRLQSGDQVIVPAHKGILAATTPTGFVFATRNEACIYQVGSRAVKQFPLQDCRGYGLVVRDLVILADMIYVRIFDVQTLTETVEAVDDYVDLYQMEGDDLLVTTNIGEVVRVNLRQLGTLKDSSSLMPPRFDRRP
jgi:hypothetical protein